MLTVEVSRFINCKGLDCPLGSIPEQVANPDELELLCEELGLEVVSYGEHFTAICQVCVGKADLLMDPYARCGQVMIGG